MSRPILPHQLDKDHSADAVIPPAAQDADERFLTLPAECFYWSVIETNVLPPRNRRDPKSLGYLFEDALPLPLERIHAVFAPLDGDRVLACGIQIGYLESLVQQHPGLLVLSPRAAAERLNVDPQRVGLLNLCTGAYEPVPVRTARRRLALFAASIWLTGLGLLLVGIERRIASHDRLAESLIAARQNVIAQTLGPDVISGRQPAELRFVAELRTLRQTRRQQPDQEGDAQNLDVLNSFASLARRWPSHLHVLAESLTITPTAMTLRAVASTSREVQELADSLMPIDGWRAQQPQVNAASDRSFSATLQWTPRPPSTRHSQASDPPIQNAKDPHSAMAAGATGDTP